MFELTGTWDLAMKKRRHVVCQDRWIAALRGGLHKPGFAYTRPFRSD